MKLSVAQANVIELVFHYNKMYGSIDGTIWAGTYLDFDKHEAKQIFEHEYYI